MIYHIFYHRSDPPTGFDIIPEKNYYKSLKLPQSDLLLCHLLQCIDIQVS